MSEYLVVARLGAPHGVKGRLRIIPLIEPEDSLSQIKKLYVLNDNEYSLIENMRILYQNKQYYLEADNWQDRDEAQASVNHDVYAMRSDLPLPPKGRYYFADLLGCQIMSVTGENLGILTDILQYHTDIYEITDGEESFLLPAVKDFIKEIDIKKRIITVFIPEGLR